MRPAPLRPAPPPTRAPIGARRARGGVSLLELVAVVALTGIFAVVALARCDGLFGDAEALTQAERTAALLHRARRGAILHGTVRGLHFEQAGGRIVRMELSEWNGAVRTALDEPVVLPDGLAVTCSAPQARYGFEGVPPDGGLTIDFAGPHRTWRLTCPAGTGALRISELPSPQSAPTPNAPEGEPPQP